MRRNVSLSEISDGRLYGDNDMVKADCHGCEGCCDCCVGMGTSIILDPYDVWRLTAGLGREFSTLLEKEVELNVVDGCILPNLKMVGPTEQCAFLDDAKRCSIHGSRPGICRLFPLGRYYEDGAFRYFLQQGECSAARTKVKVSRWIDTPDQKRYREFVTEWHYFLNGLEECIQNSEDDTFRKSLNMLMLKLFYLLPYDTAGDFYGQIEERFRLFHENSGLQPCKTRQV